MIWQGKAPGHQQPCYRLCRINQSAKSLYKTMMIKFRHFISPMTNSVVNLIKPRSSELMHPTHNVLNEPVGARKLLLKWQASNWLWLTRQGQSTKLTMFQITACRPFVTDSLFKPMLTLCSLDPCEQSSNLDGNSEIFILEKSFENWFNCCLQNTNHFILASSAHFVTA